MTASLPTLPTPVEGLIESIYRDHESGAFYLTGQAAEAFRLLAEAAATDPTDIRDQVDTLCRRLVAAQPSMAPIHALAMRCRRACETASPVTIPQAMAQAVSDFQAQMSNSLKHIGMFALPLVPDGGTVLTLSSSATVIHTLRVARQAGKKFRVICTESRPQNEGILLARALAESGIPVTLTLDAALADVIADTVAMVGADACMPTGVVNKVGTRTLALLAGIHDTPCYALCGQEKLLPASWATDFRIVDQDPTEILSEAIPGVSVVNRYFDVTPLHWFSSLVTDAGILSPAEVLRRLIQMENDVAIDSEETNASLH